MCVQSMFEKLMESFRKDNRKRKKVSPECNMTSSVELCKKLSKGNFTFYPDDNGVIAQSPIGLDETEAERWLPPRLLSFTGHWRLGSEVLALNNGITALLTYVDRLDLPILTGGPLKTPFYFAQLHFHWGEDSHNGTEHSIDGKKFACEAHIVHYNGKYAKFEEAATQPDGLAVTGFLLKISEKVNPSMQPLVDTLMKISEPTQEAKMKSGDMLNWMLDIDLNERYFTYRGSLTTDPFLESVTWIVFENTIDISECQMECFRKMNLISAGKKVHCNARVLQKTPPNLQIFHVQDRDSWLHQS